MTLPDYLEALKKHWIVILVLTLLGAGTGFAYSQFVPDQYRAQASVIVIPERGDDTSQLVQGSTYVQNLVQTYAVLTTLPAVLSPVIDDLGLDEDPVRLARRVEATTPLNTVIIQISVTDASAEGAQQTADAIAAQLAVAVDDLSPTGADDRPAVRIETVAPAQKPRLPFAPNTRMNAALGAGVGLALGVIFALLRRRFDSRLRTRADLAGATDERLFGEVPQVPAGRSLPAAVRARPDGAVAESLRQLAASVTLLDSDDPRRVILVTSAQSAEGASSVSLGLALTLAELGNRVLYLETDLRRPAAATYTHLDGSVGLTTVLSGERTLADAAQEWGHRNLHVLMSGVIPPNPGGLISSPRLRTLIAQARDEYDYVIVDCAAVLSVSDARWLAPAADTVLFVVRYGMSTDESLQRGLAALDGACSSVGLVLNGVAHIDETPYRVEEDIRDQRAAHSRDER